MSDVTIDKVNYEFVIKKQRIVDRILYSFQEESIKKISELNEKSPNGFSGLLVLPTGSGKTFTSCYWVMQNYIDKHKKVLWLAHRHELLTQAGETFFNISNNDTLPNREKYKMRIISQLHGRSVTIKPSDDLIIASVASVVSEANFKYFNKWAKGSDDLLIVIDEAHHAPAKSYRTIIESLKKVVPKVSLLGLTATPFRTSEKEKGSLKNVFTDDIIYKKDMKSLISLGILSQPEFREIKTYIDMTEEFSDEDLENIAKKDLSIVGEEKLKKLTQNAPRNRKIVNTYVNSKDEYGQTIVFAIDVLNAIALDSLFKAEGINSAFVVSGLAASNHISISATYNRNTIDAFRKGEIDVLINVNILTEGTDLPKVNSIFLARPTISNILMTQMIGRGLRGEGAGGTRKAYIVSFVDDWKNMIDFVSPEKLLSGYDIVGSSSIQHGGKVESYSISIIQELTRKLDESIVIIDDMVNNILPLGVYRCQHALYNENEDEIEHECEVMVFDDAIEIYRKIIEKLPNLIDSKSENNLTDEEIVKLSRKLFFENFSDDKRYLGVTSKDIYNIIAHYNYTGTSPELLLFDDRVLIGEMAKSIFMERLSFEETEKRIKKLWQKDKRIRNWFSEGEFVIMIYAYLNRFNKIEKQKPIAVIPPREEMDMWTLKQYYPEYYYELREYVFANAKNEDGYYYSSILYDEKGRPTKSQYRRHFEIDHIIPFSKGGKTVKENLQLLMWYQNREKGNKSQNNQ